jgi:hypothetical protein
MALKYIVEILSFDKPNPHNPSYKPQVRLRWNIHLYADGRDREGDWDTYDHFLRSKKGDWKFVAGPDPDDGQLEVRANDSPDPRYRVESSYVYMVLDGWTYFLGDPWAGPGAPLGGEGRITGRGGERAWPGPIQWRIVHSKKV